MLFKILPTHQMEKIDFKGFHQLKNIEEEKTKKRLSYSNSRKNNQDKKFKCAHKNYINNINVI